MDRMNSLFLLGQRPSSPLLFERHRRLMELSGNEGEFLSFESDQAFLSCYEKDSQLIHAKLPLLVFRPFTIHHIPPFLRNCHRLEISVAVRCGGTGLAGGCIASAEGVVLATGHLKNIASFDAAKGTLCVEPGVTGRELNRFAAADGWHFPLSMASDGVAGLAGCLSGQARGYHQQQDAVYDSIEWVKIADGEGKVFEVPSSFVCGAEGLWGIILEMKVRLQKICEVSQEYVYRGSWHALFDRLPLLRSIQSLSFIVRSQDAFYLGLKGEAWRMGPAAALLRQYLPEIQPMAEQSNKTVFPKRGPFVVFSTALDPTQLPEAHQFFNEEARKFQIECSSYSDLLAGSLQLVLHSCDDNYAFARKSEQFFVHWAEFVEKKRGMLGNCHGIGLQMGPFMTPFWNEETVKIWKRMKAVFDPKDLLGREKFFPPQGKSLERR